MNTNGVKTNWQETPAGQQVMIRFSEEKTLNTIEHLLARIGTLEKAVDDLTTLMRQGPGLAAMVTDMADEAYRKADSTGINIDQRLKNALSIAEKLTSPSMTEKLDKLTEFAEQAPGLAAMTTDMIDEAYRKADLKGVNIDERMQNALNIAEKLTHPNMVEKLENVIQIMNQAPGLAAMTTDIIDEQLRNAIAKGIDPQELTEFFGTALQALSEAKREEPKKVGVFFGVMKAFGDSDRQKALGFMMNFLKKLGKKL